MRTLLLLLLFFPIFGFGQSVKSDTTYVYTYHFTIKSDTINERMREIKELEDYGKRMGEHLKRLEEVGSFIENYEGSTESLKKAYKDVLELERRRYIIKK